MSWQTINKILVLATIDSVFAKLLLKEPQKALNAYGIELLPEELTTLCMCQAQTLPELSQHLTEKLNSETLQ